MKIGLDARCSSDHFPGVGRHVFQLVRALTSLLDGDSLLLLVDGAARGSRLDVASLSGARVVEAGSPFSVLAANRARTLLRRERVDVVHAPYLLGVRTTPCPRVLTFHDAIPLSFPSSMPSRFKRLGFRASMAAALRGTHSVVTPSAASAEELRRLFKFPGRRIHVVPHAAGEHFQPTPLSASRPVLHRLGIETPFVLCLASSRPHKNLVGCLAAWNQLPRHLTAPRKLVIVGPQDPRFAKSFQTLSAGSGIMHVPSVAEQDLPALLSAAELYVQPSFREGFGLPVIEAMACGTAVACSDAPGLRETAGGAAELFDPSSAEDIARSITALLSDEDRRQRKIHDGLRRAQQLSWRATATAMLDIYRQAAEQP